jgi:hypothetical protein
MQKYKTLSAPLLINSAEVDEAFPTESQIAADKILGEGQFAAGYKRLCVVLVFAAGILSNVSI